MLDRFVDFRHRIHLDGRRDTGAAGKLHQFTQLVRRARCGTGDAAVATDQRKGGNRERFQHGTDGMEVSAIGQRLKVGLPVEIDIYGVDDQIELPRQGGQRLGIAAVDHFVSTHREHFLLFGRV